MTFSVTTQAVDTLMGPSLRKDDSRTRLRKSQSVCADHPQTRFAQLMPTGTKVNLHSCRRARSHVDMRLQLAAIVEQVVDEDHQVAMNFSRPTERTTSTRSSTRALDVRERISPQSDVDPDMHSLAVRTTPTHFSTMSIWRARPEITNVTQHKSKNFISSLVRLIA